MSPNIPSTRFESAIVWIGAFALCALGLLICASVGLRLTGAVIKGNAEIGEMLIIIVASTSLVTATFSGAHPYVHMLVDRLAKRRRALLAALIGTIAALYWAITAWVNADMTIDNARVVEQTELLKISLTPFRIIWVASLTLIAILLAVRAVQSLRSDPPKRDG